jgi:hypothetical protein
MNQVVFPSETQCFPATSRQVCMSLCKFLFSRLKEIYNGHTIANLKKTKEAGQIT